MTNIADMPALRAEDDGFLMQLKEAILDKHLGTLGIDGCKTLDDCVEKIMRESAEAVDKGSQLPIYVPVRDDDGLIIGSGAQPVWSGAHVDVPLYGDLYPEKIRALITGNRVGARKLYGGFLAYSPAFRVALLVHHICQIVLIHPLAAEAFVLDRYQELPFEDEHFETFGVPSTELFSVESNLGLEVEWVATGPHSLSGALRSGPRINGWRISVRGSQPKESLLQETWQAIRDQLDEPRLLPYTIGGKKAIHPDPVPSGRSRKRTGDPDVDMMMSWVDGRLKTGEFPMRGKFKDWKRAAVLLGRDYPHLSGRWSSEAMRKAYERRKRRGY